MVNAGPAGPGADRFVAPYLVQDDPQPDLAAYSFFGDLAGADDALEDGLEAPPEEEVEAVNDFDIDELQEDNADDDADLSCAAMFAPKPVGARGSAHSSTLQSAPQGQGLTGLAFAPAGEPALSSRRTSSSSRPEFVGLGIGGVAGFETAIAGTPLKSTLSSSYSRGPASEDEPRPPSRSFLTPADIERYARLNAGQHAMSSISPEEIERQARAQALRASSASSGFAPPGMPGPPGFLASSQSAPPRWSAAASSSPLRGPPPAGAYPPNGPFSPSGLPPPGPHPPPGPPPGPFPPLGPRPPPLGPGRAGPRPPPGPPGFGPPPPMPPLTGSPRGPPPMPEPAVRYNGRLRNSMCMTVSEQEELLAISWRNTHSGVPYVEDFYYQAFLNRRFNGCNATTFRPDQIYGLASHEKTDHTEHDHANVEGLGKFVYSNLRTPRQLLVIDSGDESPDGAAPEPDSNTAADSDDGADDVVVAAPQPRVAPQGSLQMDKHVAARKVIEDCNCQLMDVDDIDRIFTAARSRDGKKPNEKYLLQRRQLLLENVAQTMRLPAPPTAPPSDAPVDAVADDVFRFLMRFAKGRKLVARVLERVFPPQMPRERAPPRRAHGLGVLLAVLRNAKMLFGGNMPSASADDGVVPEEAARVLSSQHIARAASAAIASVQQPKELLLCFEAFAASDAAAAVRSSSGGVMNLVLLTDALQEVPGSVWFEDVLLALFHGSQRADLANSGISKEFATVFDETFEAVMAHVDQVVHTLLNAAEGGLPLGPDVKRMLQHMAVPRVLAVLLDQCSQSQKDRLQASVAQLR